MKSSMSMRKVLQIEWVNYLATNMIPRSQITAFVGWLSQIQSPLLTKVLIFIWSRFTDLDFSDSEKQAFGSLRECFIRKLKPGARTISLRQRVILSPCDGIIGAYGDVSNGKALQIKGSSYSIKALFDDSDFAEKCSKCKYLTLRLTSSMYHRFHSPSDSTIEYVKVIPGEIFNVNPITLKRKDNLFCKNERVVIQLRTHDTSDEIILVAVGAILVGSVRLHCIDRTIKSTNRKCYQFWPNKKVSRGEELGWFEHGSTILVFLNNSCEFERTITLNKILLMGNELANY